MQLGESGGTNQAAADRRKRYANKVRTGCMTCRKRHIKCDEAKPTCKQCAIGGRICAGYYYQSSTRQPSPPDFPVPAESRATLRTHGKIANRQVESHDRSGLAMNQELIPPDWGFMEGCRYYTDILWPAQNQHLDSYARRPLDLGNRYRPGFLVAMTADYISRITNANSLLPHPSTTPAIGHVWSALFHYKSQILNDISNLVRDPTLANKSVAFRRMCEILSTDLSLLGFSWRLHITGFYSILTPGNIMELRTDYINKKAMQFMLNNAVIANTTSPADNQIWQIYAFSTQELKTMFSFELSSETPCPTPIFLSIIRLSYLRAVQAAGTPFKVIEPTVRQIFSEVAAFNSDEWVEPFPIPDKPEFPLMARIFQTTTILYGVLALCQHAEYSAQRLALRTELLGLIRRAAPLLKCRTPLAWALSVVAVALADGPTEDKELIEDILCGHPETDNFYVPLFRMRMLKKFWSSGKTAWDDCYFEPFPPLS